MAAFLAILGTLAPIFGIMLLGAFAHRRHILPEPTAHCLNLFVYWFSLPLLLFYQLARMKPEDVPPAATQGYVLGLAVALVLGTVLLRILLREKGKEALMLGLLGSFPNAAFMGMPIIFLLYPDHSGAAIMAGLAVVLTSINLIVVDTALDLKGGHNGTGDSQRRSPWRIALRILRSLYRNPMMVCAASGAAVSLTSVPLPETLLTVSRMIGSTASPCALFCMGMSLSAQLAALPQKGQEVQGQSASLGQPRRQIFVGVSKLLVSPLLVFALAYALGERGPTLVAATVMAAMPTAVVAYVLAEKYHAAAQDTSFGILSNTLASVLSLPVVIALAQWAAG